MLSNDDCYSHAVDFLINELLIKWSCIGKVKSFGLPQGPNASIVLADVYLYSVDRAMEKAGIQYFRYMDDVRIFAFDRPGLKRNMITLVRALRELKLNLNAKKTSIYEIEDYAKLKGVVDPKRDLLSKIDNIIRSEKDEEIDNIKQDLIELGEISMKEEGTFSGRHFHFFVRRIADLMKMNKLDKEYVISLTEKLLIRFESEHHESSLISWFLVAASLYIDSLKAEVQKWLINFICDENRNIYEWQEMWALDTIRQIGKI